MSTPNSITIDGVEYTPTGNAEPTTKQIIVADRGWVFVGNTTTDEQGNITQTNASVIRRWGTTKGLGQLALEGPTNDTKLDACGTVKVPVASVVAVFNVNESSWK